MKFFIFFSFLVSQAAFSYVIPNYQFTYKSSDGKPLPGVFVNFNYSYQTGILNEVYKELKFFTNQSGSVNLPEVNVPSNTVIFDLSIANFAGMFVRCFFRNKNVTQSYVVFSVMNSNISNSIESESSCFLQEWKASNLENYSSEHYQCRVNMTFDEIQQKRDERIQECKSYGGVPVR